MNRYKICEYTVSYILVIVHDYIKKHNNVNKHCFYINIQSLVDKMEPFNFFIIHNFFNINVNKKNYSNLINI